MQATFTLAGDAASFDADRFRESILTAFSDADDVTLSVTPASINVNAQIVMRSSASAETAAAIIASTPTSTVQTWFDSAGVVIVDVPSVYASQGVFTDPPPPSPPLFPPPMATSNGMSTIVVLVIIVVCLGIIALEGSQSLRRLKTREPRPNAREKAREEAVAEIRSVIQVLQDTPTPQALLNHPNAAMVLTSPHAAPLLSTWFANTAAGSPPSGAGFGRPRTLFTPGNLGSPSGASALFRQQQQQPLGATSPANEMVGVAQAGMEALHEAVAEVTEAAMVEDELRRQKLLAPHARQQRSSGESLSPPRSIPVTILLVASNASASAICVPSRRRLSLRHDDGDWEERTHDALEDARPCGGATSIRTQRVSPSPSACAWTETTYAVREAARPGTRPCQVCDPRQLPPPRANVKTGVTVCYRCTIACNGTVDTAKHGLPLATARQVDRAAWAMGRVLPPPSHGSGLILSELRPVGTYDTFMV